MIRIALLSETEDKNVSLIFAIFVGICFEPAPLAAQGISLPKPRTEDQAKGITPLMVAAANCKLDTLEALLASNPDVNAVYSEGYNALSYAHQLHWGGLKCPEIVARLIKGGADPWSARLFQNPILKTTIINKIAVLRVEDVRNNKADSAKLIDKLTHAVEYKGLKGRTSVVG